MTMALTIEEFSKKLTEMEIKYPGDASDSLEKAARKMVKAIKKETPVGKTSHPRKLNKSWKMKMVDAWGKAPKAEIRSTAPHYHLVERGVQNPKDPHGNPKPEMLAALNKHKGFLEKAVKGNWDDIKKSMEKDFYKRVRGHLG